MSLEAPLTMTTIKSASLAVPSKGGRGHRHRRSAAISLDWRHIALPAVVEPTKVVEMPAASCSPTLTFASTLSDTSVEEENEGVPIPSTQTSLAPPLASPASRRRVTFQDNVQEIPAREAGDTWLKPEDYSWPNPTTDYKTVLLDPLEPSIDLAPAIPLQVPGSPVLMHRKKRSSFLQSTKNALTRRPSKKSTNTIDQTVFDIPIPAPKSSMIDLDLVLSPNASLRHKKSGSLGAFSGLPASPSKPKSWHKRAGSAPADIIFSFHPRPASPESRKRKMSSIVEDPLLQEPFADTTRAEAEISSDAAFSRPRSTGLALAISDDMILGQPGDMVSTKCDTDGDSPAVAALKGHSHRDSISLSRMGSIKGWKGVLHRLLH